VSRVLVIVAKVDGVVKFRLAGLEKFGVLVMSKA